MIHVKVDPESNANENYQKKLLVSKKRQELRHRYEHDLRCIHQVQKQVQMQQMLQMPQMYVEKGHKLKQLYNSLHDVFEKHVDDVHDRKKTMEQKQPSQGRDKISLHNYQWRCSDDGRRKYYGNITPKIIAL